MTQINIKNTNYNIVNKDLAIHAVGEANITSDNLIQSMHLSFTEEGKNLGIATYSEYVDQTYYNFQLNDQSKKNAISELLDIIVNNIKTQIIKL